MIGMAAWPDVEFSSNAQSHANGILFGTKWEMNIIILGTLCWLPTMGHETTRAQHLELSKKCVNDGQPRLHRRQTYPSCKQNDRHWRRERCRIPPREWASASASASAQLCLVKCDALVAPPMTMMTEPGKLKPIEVNFSHSSWWQCDKLTLDYFSVHMQCAWSESEWVKLKVMFPIHILSSHKLLWYCIVGVHFLPPRRFRVAGKPHKAF